MHVKSPPTTRHRYLGYASFKSTEVQEVLPSNSENFELQGTSLLVLERPHGFHHPNHPTVSLPHYHTVCDSNSILHTLLAQLLNDSCPRSEKRYWVLCAPTSPRHVFDGVCLCLCLYRIRGEEFKISVRDKLGKFEQKKAPGDAGQAENRNKNSIDGQV